MTSSSAATSRRQFSMVKQRGGVSRMMLLCLPVMATSTCRVFIPNMISEASSALATWSLLVVSCHYYYDCWSPPCPPCPPQSRDSGRGRSRARRPHTGTWWWGYHDMEAAQRAAGGSSPVPQVEEGAPELLPNHVRRAHHLLTFDHLQNLHS